jgi:hypothetical protein
MVRYAGASSVARVVKYIALQVVLQDVEERNLAAREKILADTTPRIIIFVVRNLLAVILIYCI